MLIFSNYHPDIYEFKSPIFGKNEPYIRALDFNSNQGTNVIKVVKYHSDKAISEFNLFNKAVIHLYKRHFFV